MNKNKFERLMNRFVKEEGVMLNFKRDEYTRGDVDVLLNFKQTAGFTGDHATDVCITYLMKHVQSIVLTVKKDPEVELDWGSENGREGLAERFKDARNYLMLLAALLDENNEN